MKFKILGLALALFGVLIMPGVADAAISEFDVDYTTLDAEGRATVGLQANEDFDICYSWDAVSNQWNLTGDTPNANLTASTSHYLFDPDALAGKTTSFCKTYSAGGSYQFYAATADTVAGGTSTTKTDLKNEAWLTDTATLDQDLTLTYTTSAETTSATDNWYAETPYAGSLSYSVGSGELTAALGYVGKVFGAIGPIIWVVIGAVLAFALIRFIIGQAKRAS